MTEGVGHSTSLTGTFPAHKAGWPRTAVLAWFSSPEGGQGHTAASTELRVVCGHLQHLVLHWHILNAEKWESPSSEPRTWRRHTGSRWREETRWSKTHEHTAQFRTFWTSFTERVFIRSPHLFLEVPLETTSFEYKHNIQSPKEKPINHNRKEDFGLFFSCKKAPSFLFQFPAYTRMLSAHCVPHGLLTK